MPLKIDQDGTEVEVFTADEVKEQTDAAVKAKEDEFAPKLTEATTKLTDAEKRLAERAGEFQQFRKLSDEQVAKLEEKDRIIYDNQVKLKEAEDARVESDKTNREAAVAAVIKSKAPNNENLQKKMTEMWEIIKVDATTPEQMEAKAQMVLGAISTTTPDLLAGVAGFTGSYAPPGANDSGENKNYSDTPEGKAAAAALGLVLEPPTTK